MTGFFSHFILKLKLHEHLCLGIKQSCLVNINWWAFSLVLSQGQQWKRLKRYDQVGYKKSLASEFIKLNELVGRSLQVFVLQVKQLCTSAVPPWFRWDVLVVPSNSLSGSLAEKSGQPSLCCANLNSGASVWTEPGTPCLVRQLGVQLPQSSPLLPSASSAIPRGSVMKLSNKHNKDVPEGELDHVL